jgi:hypothetical protein
MKRRPGRKTFTKGKKQRPSKFSTAVGRALRRFALVARETARVHGTPIYIWRDGKNRG